MSMVVSVCVVAVAALLLTFSADEVRGGVQPGFQTRITQHALNYANQQAIDSWAQQVRTSSIPDQRGENGDLKYSLTSIHFTHFSKPSSAIKLVPNLGLSWSADNAVVGLSANWHVKYKLGWVKTSTSGSVDVMVSGVSFSLTMALGSDASGRPSIKSGGCRCSVYDISVHIHGDLSFVLNLFRGEVEKRIKNLIPGKLCDLANNLINNNAEDQLREIKVMTPLVQDLFVVDYRLVAPPSFQPAFMETYHSGLISWKAAPEPPPFPPAPLPPSSNASSMLYLWVGEYIPQSFVYTAQKHGFLQYNLTAKDLPPEQRGFMNTSCSDDPNQQTTLITCIGYLVPSVAKLFPGKTIVLRMNSTMVPVISMKPGLLESKMVGDMAVFVDTEKQPYLMTISVSAVFNMSAMIKDQLVKGKITGHRFKVKVIDSAVGPVNDKVIHLMVNIVMNSFIIPTLNEQGEHGFPLLATGKVKFIQTSLSILPGAMMIATDLQYNP